MEEAACAHRRHPARSRAERIEEAGVPRTSARVRAGERPAGGRIWIVTGAEFFWPVFPLLGWGIGLGFHAGHVPGREPTERQIQREMEHLRSHQV